jgi:hypothetical protein
MPEICHYVSSTTNLVSEIISTVNQSLHLKLSSNFMIYNIDTTSR